MVDFGAAWGSIASDAGAVLTRAAAAEASAGFGLDPALAGATPPPGPKPPSAANVTANVAKEDQQSGPGLWARYGKLIMIGGGVLVALVALGVIGKRRRK